jgi:hypothetical protein
MSMTPVEIINAIRAAGGRFGTGDDGRMKVRGGNVPPELVAELRGQREAVIAALEIEARQNCGAYGKCPPHDAPKVAGNAGDQPCDVRLLIVRYIFFQALENRKLMKWVAERENQYYADGFNVDDVCWRASLDALAWQRSMTPKDAIEWLIGLEEAAKSGPIEIPYEQNQP